MMQHYVGLDVSLQKTAVCVVDAAGAVVWRGECPSDPEAIAEVVRVRAPDAVRVGLETGPLSAWQVHGLRARGVPVVCLDARHAKAALGMRLNKTDRNDALGLAQIVRTGWYREVQVKDLGQHARRALLTSRAQLVRLRVDLANQIRGVLKPFGLVVGKGGGEPFAARAGELAATVPALTLVVEALLTAWRCAAGQIAVLDREILSSARGDAAIQRLMTMPGIGPVTALAYASVIGEPGRFARASSVGAYIGLTPRRHQSGEVDRQGRISKCGDPMLRAYLFEAAGNLLVRVGRWSALKAWGMRLARARGMKRAIVAVARKMAVILLRLWKDGTTFRWSEAAA